jgi:hypothetical protein
MPVRSEVRDGRLRGERSGNISRPGIVTESACSSQANDPLEAWSRLPRIIKFAAGGVVSLVLFILVLSVVNRRGVVLPEALHDRSQFVGQAFVRGDQMALEAISDPATTVSTARWLEQKRPNRWKTWNRATDAHVETTVLFQNHREKLACTLATLTFPSLADEPDLHVAEEPRTRERTGPVLPTGPRIELVLYWRLGDGGLWWLDGGRTIRESNLR